MLRHRHCLRNDTLPAASRPLKFRDRKRRARQAVALSELMQRRWYRHLLHNKRAAVLRAMLLMKGNARIVVINVPWYLEN